MNDDRDIIDGKKATHCFKGKDCIIIRVEPNNLRRVKYKDGKINFIHISRLLPIKGF